MIRGETTARLEAVTAEVAVDDGGMLTAAVHDTEADLRVSVPAQAPLTPEEPHAEVTITGAGADVTVRLSGPQLEALADALSDGDGEEGGA